MIETCVFCGYYQRIARKASWKLKKTMQPGNELSISQQKAIIIDPKCPWLRYSIDLERYAYSLPQRPQVDHNCRKFYLYIYLRKHLPAAATFLPCIVNLYRLFLLYAFVSECWKMWLLLVSWMPLSFRCKLSVGIKTSVQTKWPW